MLMPTIQVCRLYRLRFNTQPNTVCHQILTGLCSLYIYDRYRIKKLIIINITMYYNKKLNYVFENLEQIIGRDVSRLVQSIKSSKFFFVIYSPIQFGYVSERALHDVIAYVTVPYMQIDDRSYYNLRSKQTKLVLFLCKN